MKPADPVPCKNVTDLEHMYKQYRMGNFVILTFFYLSNSPLQHDSHSLCFRWIFPLPNEDEIMLRKKTNAQGKERSSSTFFCSK
jgi:hypothetical protein